MTQVKEIRTGNYVKVNNEIFKVLGKEIVNYGTHCHSKTKLILQRLFSKGHKEITLGHHESLEAVEIIRKEGQVVAKLPNKVQVMDNMSYETIDADVDNELLEVINEGDTVTFINFEGKSKVLEKRGA